MTTRLTHSVARAALVVALILVAPLLGNQFVDGWNWSLSDFVVMGAMLFAAGLLLQLAWYKAGKYRIIATAAIAILFLWLWVELAVGLFTNWGS